MRQTKSLSRRQRAVIEDLFTSELEEQAVLEKHHVSPTLYHRWLADERFMEQFEQRIAQAYRTGRIILARYATLAATRLVELTDCEKEETARKACLDIISLHSPASVPSAPATGDPKDPEATLPPEVASRLLAALADKDGEPATASGQTKPTDGESA
jgi:hypothetical protein